MPEWMQGLSDGQRAEAYALLLASQTKASAGVITARLNPLGEMGNDGKTPLKGGVGINGLGRFPLSPYAEQLPRYAVAILKACAVVIENADNPKMAVKRMNRASLKRQTERLQTALLSALKGAGFETD